MPPSSNQISDSTSGSGASRTAELICASCGTTLRTAAETSVEAPCPRCGHLLRYEAPTRAKLAPFQPRPHHTHRTRRSRTKQQHGSRRRRSLGQSFLHAIRETNEFLDTSTGRLAASAVLAVLAVLCVLLFFRWDKTPRVPPREPAAEMAKPQPAASSPSQSDRLPESGSPEAAPDPFSLPDHLVIEVTAPIR